MLGDGYWMLDNGYWILDNGLFLPLSKKKVLGQKNRNNRCYQFCKAFKSSKGMECLFVKVELLHKRIGRTEFSCWHAHEPFC